MNHYFNLFAINNSRGALNFTKSLKKGKRRETRAFICLKVVYQKFEINISILNIFTLVTLYLCLHNKYTFLSDQSASTVLHCTKKKTPTKKKTNTIHHITTMLATSNNDLFSGHCHLLNISTDDPSLAFTRAINKVSGYHCQWLAGGYDLEIGHF